MRVPRAVPRSSRSQEVAVPDLVRVFGGSANPELTREICTYLGSEPGLLTVHRFSDGETLVQI
jgi:phosphoribosylpyrophosphate synthetase